MRRNIFPKDQVVRIAEAAGIRGDIEKLTENYDFEVARGRRTYGRRLAELTADERPDRTDVVAAIWDRWRVFHEGGPGVTHELRALFRTLRTDNIYMCCFGDALPVEWTGTGWGVLGVELAEAVARGARLIYVFPSADAVHRLQSLGLYEYLGPEAVLGAMAQFRSRVSSIASGFGESILAERITSLGVDAGCFFAPRHQYILVAGPRDEAARTAGFLRVTESASAGAPVLIPLGREVVGGMLSMLMSAAEHSGNQWLTAQLGSLSP